MKENTQHPADPGFIQIAFALAGLSPGIQADDSGESRRCLRLNKK